MILQFLKKTPLKKKKMWQKKHTLWNYLIVTQIRFRYTVDGYVLTTLKHCGTHHSGQRSSWPQRFLNFWPASKDSIRFRLWWKAETSGVLLVEETGLNGSWLLHWTLALSHTLNEQGLYSRFPVELTRNTGGVQRLLTQKMLLFSLIVALTQTMFPLCRYLLCF